MMSTQNPNSPAGSRRRRCLRLGLAWLLLTLSGIGIAHGQEEKPGSLAPRFRQWLDLVDYIITPEERNIFLLLANDRDRDAFTNVFWSQRDPTRGTPENEFKDEHIKRFQYADRYYGFSSPLPGWKTDRGRIHILLGPPTSRNEVFNSYLYPIEIWEYYGDPGKGLPTMFHVVFYRKGGAGDFKLYIPAQDGPDQLLVTQIGEFNSFDYRAIYQKLHEIKPEVAEIALTLIPGERTANFAPSMRDLTLMARIADLPKENLNTTYASQFLHYKSFVNVEDSFDYLSSRHEVLLLRDPLSKITFLHFAIWPERISVDYSDAADKYFCAYKLVVDLRRGDRTIYQYTKDLPFSYAKTDMEKTLASGLILADMVPVIDGDFEVTVFVQNSVNREFASFHEKIHVPAPGAAAIFGPLVSYRIRQEAHTALRAYSVQNLHASPDPQRTFGEQEPLQVLFGLDSGTSHPLSLPLVELISIAAPGAVSSQRPLTAKSHGGQAVQVFTAEVGVLPAGHYRLRVTIPKATGGEAASAETTFSVSRLPTLPHPPVAAPSLAGDKSFVFLGMLAAQYDSSNRTDEALRTYEEALRQGSGNAPLRIAYARFLLAKTRHERLLEVLAPLEGQEKSAFDFHALRGKALYQLGRTQEAVDELLKANQLYDSDSTVLNALGLAFLRLNQPVEAKKALSASLKINPDQPDITALLNQTDLP